MHTQNPITLCTQNVLNAANAIGFAGVQDYLAQGHTLVSFMLDHMQGHLGAIDLAKVYKALEQWYNTQADSTALILKLKF